MFVIKKTRRTKRRKVFVISTNKRPVPLQHFLMHEGELDKLMQASRLVECRLSYENDLHAIKELTVTKILPKCAHTHTNKHTYMITLHDLGRPKEHSMQMHLQQQ